jgi:hypothetical protein
MESIAHDVGSLDAFLGNAATLHTLQTILDNPSQPTGALVFGGSGTGKSTVCELLAARYEATYDILMVKRHGVDTDKGIKALVDNFLRSKTIESFFSNKHSKLVILDDIDIHMSTERGYMLYLQQLMTSLRKIKAIVIMTCCAADEKKTNDLKRKVPHVLRLVSPAPEEAYDTFYPIFARSFPDMHDLERRLAALIDVAGGNVRYILNNAHMIMKDDEAAMTAERGHRAFLHCSTIEGACKILRGGASGSIRDMDSLADPMVSHVLYENYVHEMCANRHQSSADELANTACRVMDTWILSDILETHIFRASDWGLYGYLNVLRVGSIANALAGMKRKKVNSKAPATYTPVLSKLALRSTFGKKLAALKDACCVYDDDAMFTMLDRIHYRRDLSTDIHASPMLRQVLLPYMEYMHEVDKKVVTKLRRRRTGAGGFPNPFGWSPSFFFCK